MTIIQHDISMHTFHTVETATFYHILHPTSHESFSSEGVTSFGNWKDL